jgi:hypothetical protein
MHVKNIFEDKELSANLVIKNVGKTIDRIVALIIKQVF